MSFERFILDNYKNIEGIIKEEYKNNTCYPKYEDIFKAFKLTPYENVKVVIIGQDPYHTKGYANGLAFSVPNNIKISPSLANIFKELKSDLNVERSNSDLSDWAKQGVFLINASLSVIENRPGSHLKYWESFTDECIKYLEKNDNVIIYILWGNFAKAKKNLITNKNHYIIESSHPSPLGAYHGFFGSKPFSKCNEILEKNNISKINW